MKKNGFTLIELLGSIVILAVIALLAFPVVLDFLNDSNSKMDESMKKSVVSAASEYVNDNVNNFNKSNLPKNVRTSDLIDNGYITNKNIIKNDSIKNSCVTVNINSSRAYTYSYVDNC